MAAIARLESAALHPDAELAQFLQGRAADGAVVSFTGLARARSKSGAQVERLVLDWYPGLTERSLADIAAEAERRFEVSDVLVVHRCGVVEAGEPIVFAAAAARHRREAFLAADYLMDRLKTDAAFWKREEGEGGSRWIEPTDEDLKAQARWEKP